MTDVRTRLRRDGWQAVRLLCQDDNGGVPLVARWHILKRADPKPRPGELMGGHRTRAQAWEASEDYYRREASAAGLGAIEAR